MTGVEPLLPTCGCCDAGGHSSVADRNRPGLSALSYRAGTHGSFSRTMLARLGTQPETRRLTTREPDDPAIALVDAWASVLDVLSFYQERIANEGYLRTATERLSVRELAAEIGYQPSPGVAASGYLAFELETGPGAPQSVEIPTGTQVQSVPGPEERPQMFETAEKILARPAWNRVPVRSSSRRIPGQRDTEAWLDGTATNLRPGDAILLVGRERDERRASDNWDFRILTAVEPDAVRGVTRVSWAEGLGWRAGGRWVLPAAEDMRCFALRQRAGLFGAAAPDFQSMPATVQRDATQDAAARGFRRRVSAAEWPALRISGIADGEDHPDRTIFLDALYPRLVANSWIVLQQPSYSELYRPDRSLGTAAIASDARTGFTLSAKTTRVVLEGENLIEMFDSHVRDTVVFFDSEELALGAAPIVEPLVGRTIEVDDPLTGLEKGRAILVLGTRARLAVSEGRRVDLHTAAGDVQLQPRDVVIVREPPAVTGTTRTWFVETLAGERGTVTEPVADRTLIPIAPPADAERVAEPAVIESIAPLTGDPTRATIHLVEPLTIAFDRPSATVAVNVAPATHGQQRTEVLGSGDASEPFQAFALKQSPLTHVPAATPSGAVSTLDVRIDGIAWRETSSLEQAGERDRAFVTEIADDGTATVRFGDGRTGARLPTGIENVRAGYRVGIGSSGNVKAGQLSLLMTRPLGVRGVTNPLPTHGGTDPESRDEARANAPRNVLTFDRVVSRRDFADFARSFAGIARSEARWVWEGRARMVLVTVAGTGGQDVVDDPTGNDLRQALRASGDPHVRFTVLSYEPLTFDVEAGVFVAEDHDGDRVVAAVRSALLDAFSFARRELAQSVTHSEVAAVIQAVDGVLGVDLDPDGIRLTGERAPRGPVLVARPGRSGQPGPLPAQLITVRPAGIAITRRT